jgi:hypothetical protein
MRIDLIMDDSAQEFFDVLKKKNDELIIPLNGWIAYIRDNSNIKPEDVPSHKVSGTYVITEREWFGEVARSIDSLYYHPVRLLHNKQGAFWYSELEPKKKMPKHDIFDVGNRQSGSFRSNG